VFICNVTPPVKYKTTQKPRNQTRRTIKSQKTRQLHEIRRHKWKDMFRNGKHFLLRMRHPSWCPLCRIKDNNIMVYRYH